MTIRDRIAGSLYGVAVADALGGPLEFLNADTIEERHGYVTEMIGGGWLNLRPGEVTDDTQMTFAVAEGIMENPDDPIAAIGERFIAWARSGPKDIGGTCSASIQRATASSPTGRPTEAMWFAAANDTAKANRAAAAVTGPS